MFETIFKKYQLLFLILLGYITILSFYPCLSANFCSLDDTIMVQDNPYIREISSANLKHIFTNLYFRLYHPLVTLSYMIEYHFFQLDAWIFHVDNVLLHLLNSLLVFFIFKTLTKSSLLSYIVALLFAIHPSRVEPVAWISARKDTLLTFFYFVAFLFYVKSYDAKRNIFYLITSFIFFILACMSKPMAVTFPAVMVLTDFCFGRFSLKQSLKYLPFIAVSAVLCLITVGGYYSEEHIQTVTLYTRAIDILNAHFNTLYYLKDLFYPAYTYIHPVFYNEYQLPPAKVLYSPALLWLIVFAVTYSLKYTKKIFFGFMLFLIILLPVSGVMQTGVSPVTERYVYMAFVGLFYLVAEFMLFVYTKFNKYKILLCTLAVALFISMAVATNYYSSMWQDNLKLLDLSIKAFPDTADKAYLMRGMVYKNEENYDLAKEYLNKSLKINPKTSYVHFNIGHLKHMQGEKEEAIKYYNKIPPQAPDYAATINNIAVIYHDTKETQQAIDFLEERISKIKDMVYDFPYFTLSSFYYELKDYDKAQEYALKTLSLNSKHKSSYLKLFNIYKEKGDVEKIQELTDNVVANFPKHWKYLNFAGIYFFERGDYNAAETLFRLSLKEKIKNDRAYFFLGNIYALKQDYKKALICYTMAILNNRASGEYNFKRAAVFLCMGKYEPALKDMNVASSKGYDVPKEFKEDIKQEIANGAKK